MNIACDSATFLNENNDHIIPIRIRLNDKGKELLEYTWIDIMHRFGIDETNLSAYSAAMIILNSSLEKEISMSSDVPMHPNDDSTYGRYCKYEVVSAWECLREYFKSQAEHYI